jgi:hypothetical protein
MDDPRVDWADMDALRRLSLAPSHVGITQPVRFTLVAAELTRVVSDRLASRAAEIRERYAWRQKCARLRESMRMLQQQLRRLQTGSELEGDRITGTEARLQWMLDRANHNLEQWKAAAMVAFKRPSLLLDPEDPVEVAWLALGVEAGIISSCKARELLGGIDIDQWRAMAPISEDAMSRIVEAVNDTE